MKMHINTLLETRVLKKEELELRKLKKTKSYLKEDDSLNKWFISQINRRTDQIKKLIAEDSQKYMGKY